MSSDLREWKTINHQSATSLCGLSHHSLCVCTAVWKGRTRPSPMKALCACHLRRHTNIEASRAQNAIAPDLLFICNWHEAEPKACDPPGHSSLLAAASTIPIEYAYNMPVLTLETISASLVIIVETNRRQIKLPNRSFGANSVCHFHNFNFFAAREYQIVPNVYDQRFLFYGVVVLVSDACLSRWTLNVCVAIRPTLHWAAGENPPTVGGSLTAGCELFEWWNARIATKVNHVYMHFAHNSILQCDEQRPRNGIPL